VCVKACEALEAILKDTKEAKRQCFDACVAEDILSTLKTKIGSRFTLKHRVKLVGVLKAAVHRSKKSVLLMIEEVSALAVVL
jgi:hypothetical protein